MIITTDDGRSMTLPLEDLATMGELDNMKNSNPSFYFLRFASSPSR